MLPRFDNRQHQTSLEASGGQWPTDEPSHVTESWPGSHVR